jgi:hypothetical protein
MQLAMGPLAVSATWRTAAIMPRQNARANCMAGTDAIPYLVLSHLLREKEAAKDASAAANATNWSILRRPCLPWVRSRVRQNTTYANLSRS